MTAPDTRQREEWDGTPVPPSRWAKDHWSTFAYIETCVVDRDGYVDPRRMRGRDARYPTRLRDTLLVGHGDVDCAADAIAAGFLEGGRATHRDSRGEILALTWRYSLTERGLDVAAALRRWKATGGQFAAFTLEGVS